MLRPWDTLSTRLIQIQDGVSTLEMVDSDSKTIRPMDTTTTNRVGVTMAMGIDLDL